MTTKSENLLRTVFLATLFAAMRREGVEQIYFEYDGSGDSGFMDSNMRGRWTDGEDGEIADEEAVLASLGLGEDIDVTALLLRDDDAGKYYSQGDAHDDDNPLCVLANNALYTNVGVWYNGEGGKGRVVFDAAKRQLRVDHEWYVETTKADPRTLDDLGAEMDQIAAVADALEGKPVEPFHVRGSHGGFEVQPITGDVLKFEPDTMTVVIGGVVQPPEPPDEHYAAIARFDLDEYRRWNEQHWPGTQVVDADILHIGWWKRDGTYVEAEADARTDAISDDS